MGFLLFIISILLTALFLPLGILFALFSKRTKIGRYFLRLAIIVDILANSAMGTVFNKWLTKGETAYPFGQFPNTISYALGKNKELGTLTKLGDFITRLLNYLDNNHVEDAVQSDLSALNRFKNIKHDIKE